MRKEEKARDKIGNKESEKEEEEAKEVNEKRIIKETNKQRQTTRVSMITHNTIIFIANEIIIPLLNCIQHTINMMILTMLTIISSQSFLLFFHLHCFNSVPLD